MNTILLNVDAINIVLAYLKIFMV